jgi:hypothetical protein
VPEWAVPNRVKFGVAFAVIGAAAAIGLLAYNYLFLVGPDGFNHATLWDDYLFIILCPPSIALMELERASPLGVLIGHSFIVLENAGLYGFVGWVVGAVADKLHKAN